MSNVARFGVQVDLTDASEFLQAANTAEAAGLYALFVPDHPSSCVSPFVALGAAAMVTARIRLGTYVLNTGVHHPLQTTNDLNTSRNGHMSRLTNPLLMYERAPRVALFLSLKRSCSGSRSPTIGKEHWTRSLVSRRSMVLISRTTRLSVSAPRRTLQTRLRRIASVGGSRASWPESVTFRISASLLNTCPDCRLAFHATGTQAVAPLSQCESPMHTLASFLSAHNSPNCTPVRAGISTTR